MHAQKETEFLRLKRSRLGVDDFDSLKVIGRGAFGEVLYHTWYSKPIIYHQCYMPEPILDRYALV